MRFENYLEDPFEKLSIELLECIRDQISLSNKLAMLDSAYESGCIDLKEYQIQIKKIINNMAMVDPNTVVELKV